jgi:hypothetical protein
MVEERGCVFWAYLQRAASLPPLRPATPRPMSEPVSCAAQIHQVLPSGVGGSRGVYQASLSCVAPWHHGGIPKLEPRATGLGSYVSTAMVALACTNEWLFPSDPTRMAPWHHGTMAASPNSNLARRVSGLMSPQLWSLLRERLSGCSRVTQPVWHHGTMAASPNSALARRVAGLDSTTLVALACTSEWLVLSGPFTFRFLLLTFY